MALRFHFWFEPPAGPPPRFIPLPTPTLQLPNIKAGKSTGGFAEMDDNFEW
jgi:hypothetical protein